MSSCSFSIVASVFLLFYGWYCKICRSIIEDHSRNSFLNTVSFHRIPIYNAVGFQKNGIHKHGGPDWFLFLHGGGTVWLEFLRPREKSYHYWALYYTHTNRVNKRSRYIFSFLPFYVASPACMREGLFYGSCQSVLPQRESIKGGYCYEEGHVNL